MHPELGTMEYGGAVVPGQKIYGVISGVNSNAENTNS